MPSDSLTWLRQKYHRYPHWNSVERFLSGVLELNPLLVLLFGSLAKGDFTQLSDADVLVLFEGPVDWTTVYGKGDGLVQPVVKELKGFEGGLAEGNTFYHEILEDGIVLYEREGVYQNLKAVADRARVELKLKRLKGGWRWAP
mgnify:CR=1 FL=1